MVVRTILVLLAITLALSAPAEAANSGAAGRATAEPCLTCYKSKSAGKFTTVPILATQIMDQSAIDALFDRVPKPTSGVGALNRQPTSHGGAPAGSRFDLDRAAVQLDEITDQC